MESNAEETKKRTKQIRNRNTPLTQPLPPTPTLDPKSTYSIITYSIPSSLTLTLSPPSSPSHSFCIFTSPSTSVASPSLPGSTPPPSVPLIPSTPPSILIPSIAMVLAPPSPVTPTLMLMLTPRLGGITGVPVEYECSFRLCCPLLLSVGYSHFLDRRSHWLQMRVKREWGWCDE